MQYIISVAGWWSDEFYSCCAICVWKCVRRPYEPSAAIISTAAGWEGQKLFGSATKAQGNGLVNKGRIIFHIQEATISFFVFCWTETWFSEC
jgi:hypothetical protein